MIYLAETTTNEFLPLLNYGGVGVCLVWFMFRSEPRLRAIEAAIDRVGRSMIVLSLAISAALDSAENHAGKSIRVQAESINEEFKDAEEKRKK